ncbi:MAG TPA: ferritin-like domain-containing protein [Candidatus Acidoferrales bacterium]|jgi:ferritin-like metal-binding protein YciE|nr:ferritin-like domain-containing protein [Candidatus Acidoferrales bacterium]
MEHKALMQLFVDELKDLYSAESQLIKALPKMAKAATSDDLRAGFEHHLEQTKEHARRIEEICSELGEKPTGKKCGGMEGLIGEGKEMMDEFEGDLLDAALISAAQRVEHYEIAAYGTVRTYAELLSQDRAVELLEETLEEEKETDQKLTELAATINVEAVNAEDSEDEEAPVVHKLKSKAARA